VALATGVALSELTPHRTTLATAYMERTRESLEFHADVV
jgi:hypothetical protein